MEVSINRGTPVIIHLNGIFPEINHTFGVPPSTKRGERFIGSDLQQIIQKKIAVGIRPWEMGKPSVWVSEKIGVSPVIIHFSGIYFWGTP